MRETTRKENGCHLRVTGYSVSAVALIVPPGRRSAWGAGMDLAPLTGACLGFNSAKGRQQCSQRLRRLGYYTTAYMDVNAEYALYVGGKQAQSAINCRTPLEVLAPHRR